ncbi:hypothetical protein AB1K84_06360 [Mesobacillus foraminis]
MFTEEEYLLFINEIGKLIEEYKNCPCPSTKLLIEEHIALMGEAIA